MSIDSGSQNRINEYEAAIKYGFSPDLLRWFSKNPVIDGNTLPFTEIDSIYYFDQEDIEALDKKMSGKWPLPPKGARPTIPAGIEREIKEEAQFTCPVCHKTPGEIAHFQAVSSSYCNHPSNLIFLCDNHHEELDYRRIYKNVSQSDLKAYKKSLGIFRKHQWSLKGNIINGYLGYLNSYKSLLEIHALISKSIPDETFNALLSEIAASIDKKNRAGGVVLEVEALEKEIVDYTTGNPDGLCPLCRGSGSTTFYNPCPICLGNGEIEEGNRRLLYVSDYFLIECQLCEGSGEVDGDTCPACNGEKEVPREWSDNHDWSQYDFIDCQLCKGSGEIDNDTCPACNGEKEVSRGWADHHDWSRYDFIDCQLCEGSGEVDDDTCPACNGEKIVSRGWADHHNWSQYDFIDCQLCEGSGEVDDDTCPACDGEKIVSRGWADNHDWSRYEHVDCRLCEGSGEHNGDPCPACDGEKVVPRAWADDHDWSQYES